MYEVYKDSTGSVLQVVGRHGPWIRIERFDAASGNQSVYDRSEKAWKETLESGDLRFVGVAGSDVTLHDLIDIPVVGDYYEFGYREHRIPGRVQFVGPSVWVVVMTPLLNAKELKRFGILERNLGYKREAWNKARPILLPYAPTVQPTGPSSLLEQAFDAVPPVSVWEHRWVVSFGGTKVWMGSIVAPGNWTYRVKKMLDGRFVLGVGDPHDTHGGVEPVAVFDNEEYAADLARGHWTRILSAG